MGSTPFPLRNSQMETDTISHRGQHSISPADLAISPADFAIETFNSTTTIDSPSIRHLWKPLFCLNCDVFVARRDGWTLAHNWNIVVLLCCDGRAFANHWSIVALFCRDGWTLAHHYFLCILTFLSRIAMFWCGVAKKA